MLDKIYNIQTMEYQKYNNISLKKKLIWDRIKIKVTNMMQTGCIPLKRIRKSNFSWKRKADMDEKPMKAINIVDKKTTKIKAPDVEIKIDVEHSSSIEKRKIDGVTYLLVPLSATSDIEIDGIRLR